jgi:hypothetical protein
MNAAELRFLLYSVASEINSTIFYDQLTSEGVSADELKGTRQEATALVKALDAAPREKIDALASMYHDELTQLRGKFQGEWHTNHLQAFRDAQVMLGLVNTIFNKAGITT